MDSIKGIHEGKTRKTNGLFMSISQLSENYRFFPEEKDNYFAFSSRLFIVRALTFRGRPNRLMKPVASVWS